MLYNKFHLLSPNILESMLVLQSQDQEIIEIWT
jgi:hypothetical protein